MATQTITLLRQRNYGSGQHSWGPVGAPGIVAGRFYVLDPNSTYTDPAEHIDFDVQESFDGGATWQDLGGFTSAGTTALNKQGGRALPEIVFTFDPPTSGAETFRGVLTVTGAINFAFMLDLTTV